MSTVELQKLKFFIQQVISEELVDGDVELDHLAEMVRIRIRGFVLGEHMDVITFEYPETWWDAFKIRYFPKLLLALFPPKFAVKKWDIYALYPDFKPKLNQHTHKLVFIEYGGG